MSTMSTVDSTLSQASSSSRPSTVIFSVGASFLET